MTVSEMIRLIKKSGCRLKKHKSKHDLWINPKTGGTALIPRHQSEALATGTANDILKDLGLK